MDENQIPITKFYEIIGNLYMRASLMQDNTQNLVARIGSLQEKNAELEKLLEIHSQPPKTYEQA